MNTESALSVFWPCVAWMLIVFRAIPLLSTFLKQEERETLCSRDTAGISLLLSKQCSVLKDHPKINVHFTIIIVIWISATSRFWRTYCTWSELCDLDQNCGDLTELSSKGTWRNEPVPFVRCLRPAIPFPFRRCRQIISSHPHEHCMSAATLDGIWRSALPLPLRGENTRMTRRPFDSPEPELNHLDPFVSIT